jgi:hypothetical protein
LLSASDTFGDMSALVNRVFPVDLPAIIGVNSYAPVNLQGIIGGVQSTATSLGAFIALNNQGNIAALVGSQGGYGGFEATCTGISFGDLNSNLNIFNNQFALRLGTANAQQVEGPTLDDLGLTEFVSQNFTVSLWFRNERGNVPIIYESIAGASSSFSWVDGFGFNWESPTAIRFWYKTWNNQFVIGTVDDNLQYLHLVGVYDGSNIHFYINGEFQGSSLTPGLSRGILNSTFKIGNIADTGTPTANYARGVYEDVSFWKRDLSSDEVFELFKYSTAYNDLSIAGTFYTPDQQRIWWDTDNTVLDETYPTIVDRSPGNNDGAYINAPVDQNDVIEVTLPVRNNVSMDFPDGDCFFRTTTSDNGVPVDGTGSFSVLAIVRNQTNAFAKIVGAWNSAQTGGADAAMQLRKFSSGFGNVVLGGVQNTANSPSQPNFTIFLDNTGTTWYQMIMTFNESTGDCKAYMDADFKQNIVMTGTRKSWSEFTIGAARVSDVISEFWFAEIDTIAVWDTELTQSDVDAVYNNGDFEADLSIVGPEANLAAWYRLGESGDSLTTLQDKSGNGHHMVRIGTASNVIVTDVPN